MLDDDALPMAKTSPSIIRIHLEPAISLWNPKPYAAPMVRIIGVKAFPVALVSIFPSRRSAALRLNRDSRRAIAQGLSTQSYGPGSIGIRSVWAGLHLASKAVRETGSVIQSGDFRLQEKMP